MARYGASVVVNDYGGSEAGVGTAPAPAAGPESSRRDVTGQVFGVRGKEIMLNYDPLV